MSFELKNGCGYIFKNKNKTANIHPEYKGEFKTPSGEVLSISLWVKDSDNGKYFSASIQEPYKKTDSAIKPTDKSKDLPF